MRESKRTSSLPFEINYSGEHPAGLWLMAQLQQRYIKVNLKSTADCWSISGCDASYGVNQFFCSALGEAPLSWPFEWCTQVVDGKVKYVLNEAQVILSESERFQSSFLDLNAIATELRHGIQRDTKDFLPEETQLLSIVWKASEPKVENSGFWRVQGALSVDLVPSGLLWECEANNSRWLLHYTDESCCFSGEVQASSEQMALDITKNELPAFFFGNDKVAIQQELNTGAVQQVTPLDSFWPKIIRLENTLTIVSFQPDGSELSWLREGYCWWLMKNLLDFLDSRHSSPKQVFTRLQHLEQKMRLVLTPFLRKHRFF